MIYPRRGCKYILDISPNTPTFYPKVLASLTPDDLMIISSASAVYTLFAFRDIHGRNGEVLLLFCPGHHMTLFFFLPYPTKWGRYKMFSLCCNKDSAIIFTTGRVPDVNRP
jgi:hypothetical protein